MEQGKPETRWGGGKNKGQVERASEIQEEPSTDFSVGKDIRKKKHE